MNFVFKVFEPRVLCRCLSSPRCIVLAAGLRAQLPVVLCPPPPRIFLILDSAFYLNICSLDIVNSLDILNCLSATPQILSNFGLRLLSKQLLTAPLRLQTELLQWLGSVYIVQVLFSLYLYCHLSIFKDKTTGNHDTSTFN